MLSIPQTTIQLKYDWLRDHLGYSLEDHARNPILLTRSLTDNLGPRISYAMHRGLRGECAPCVCVCMCVLGCTGGCGVSLHPCVCVCMCLESCTRGCGVGLHPRVSLCVLVVWA